MLYHRDLSCMLVVDEQKASCFGSILCYKKSYISTTTLQLYYCSTLEQNNTIPLTVSLNAPPPQISSQYFNNNSGFVDLSQQPITVHKIYILAQRHASHQL